MKLIVGLGNPGRKYENTRHNVGFELLDQLARQHGSPLAKSKFEGQLADVAIDGQKVLLLWPHTFMNLSGRSVRAAIDFYKIPPEDLLVVCDEFHLPLGRIRLRPQGSSGGQKGLQSVLQQLGTEQICRLRIGVGPVPEHIHGADFVLGRFSSGERATANEMIERAANAARCWVAEGIEQSMNRYNKADSNKSG